MTTTFARLMERRLLVVLWATVTVLAVAVVLGATRLFHHGRSSRENVAQYINRVDGAERQLSSGLSRAVNAYRDFSNKGATPKTRMELASAERTIRSLARRVGGIPYPAEAAKLHTQLVHLARSEVSLAHEQTVLARFLPSFSKLSTTTAAADQRLGRALRAATPPTPRTIRGTATQIANARRAFAAASAEAALEQAAAIERYDNTLALVIAQTRRLHAPAVMAPFYASTLHSLEATRAAGAKLVAELRRKDRTNVAKLSRELTVAARLSQTVAAQRLEIAAVKAYNARVRSLAAMEAKIKAEVSRLQSTLS